MADPASLMQPLRTESLRPRPGAQAQYAPPSQTDSTAVPEAKPLSSPLMTPVRSLDKPKAAPPPSLEVIKPQPSLSLQDETPAEESDLLESLLQSFIEDTPDEENTPDEPDAIPTEKMPLPVFVPLYEETPRRPCRLWILPLILLPLAAAAIVLWKTGLLENILP